MQRTGPRSGRRLLEVAVSAAALLAVDALSFASPAGAGTSPAPSVLTSASNAPSLAVIFGVGGVVALLGLAAVVLGVRRGRRRR
jgi:hypothetical protein